MFPVSHFNDNVFFTGQRNQIKFKFLYYSSTRGKRFHTIIIMMSHHPILYLSSYLEKKKHDRLILQDVLGSRSRETETIIFYRLLLHTA